MRKKFIRIFSIAAISFGAIATESHIGVQAAIAVPDYADPSMLPVCTSGLNGFANKPCYEPDASPATDQGRARLDECSVSVTNFCYTLKVDGNAADSKLKATVVIGAYKTHDTTVSIAGYEAFINLWQVPTGNTLNENYFGWGKKPIDQDNNAAGMLDLTGLLTENSQIEMTINYKTSSMPQYSVLVANQGAMNFALSDQDLTLTLTGKPSRTALESAGQTIDFDTEKSDDTTKPWTDKCGFPSMKFVVCNVNTATSEPLVFFARSKTFVNSPAADIPAPIWVNTNAAYFHYPSVEIDSSGNKAIQFRTAAPHLLSDGTTVNKGNASAFLPNGILSQWKIDKTEDALKKALTTTIVKGETSTDVTAEFTTSDAGVKVYFPEITYSAPMIKVGQGKAAATPTTTTTVPAVPTKSMGKGKSKALTSLIKLVGKGKATWKASGGCKVKGSTLVAPKKAATCKLTLNQAKSGKTAARKVTINVKVS